MKFDLKRPCPHCPFRADIPGYLTAARATEIIQGLLSDDMQWFACHETTIAVEDQEGFGGRACDNRTQQCAGALILFWKMRQLNVVSRLAVTLGLLDLEALDMSAPVVDSAEQFIAHHTNAWRDVT